MVEGKDQVERLLLNGENYIISFHPISTTDWSLGVIVPEATLLSSVQITRNALNSTVQALNYKLTVTTIIILFGSTVIILLVARQIVKPLTRFTREVHRVRSSDESGTFIEKLEQIHLENIRTTTNEILDLQEAFIQMKNSLLANWKT